MSNRVFIAWSRGMVAEVIEAAGQIAAEAQEHVEGSRLDVASGLPARNCVRPQTKKSRELDLRQAVLLADRAYLVAGQKPVLLAVERDGVLLKPTRLGVRENLLAALGAPEVGNVRHCDVLPVDGRVQRAARPLHRRAAARARIVRKDDGLAGRGLRSRLLVR